MTDGIQTRIVLIDDHGLCRVGLGELISLRSGMEVVATTGRPEQAAEIVEQLGPDLLVMDLRMPGMDGLRLLQQLRDAGSRIAVVILTMSDSSTDLAAALRLGARGYLLKDMEPDDLVDAISRAAQGEFVVAPAMASRLSELIDRGAQDQQRETAIDHLTPRERQVLGHVAKGQSNKTIARLLDISPDTVKLHVRRVLSKLGFTSRVEAAVFAIEHRIELPERADDTAEHGLTRTP